MSWKAIAKKYMMAGFLLDLLVVLVDYIELIALALFSDLNQSSLTVLKILRAAKITRLFRLVAKLRCGLFARMDAMFSYWLQVHGLLSYQHLINFIFMAIKLMLFIAWLTHAGSCLWFYLQTNMESSNGRSWRTKIEDSDDDQHIYYHGMYWAVTIMFA
eukprot:1732091-Amphidinium_carterae.1